MTNVKKLNYYLVNTHSVVALLLTLVKLIIIYAIYNS